MLCYLTIFGCYRLTDRVLSPMASIDGRNSAYNGVGGAYELDSPYKGGAYDLRSAYQTLPSPRQRMTDRFHEGLGLGLLLPLQPGDVIATPAYDVMAPSGYDMIAPAPSSYDVITRPNRYRTNVNDIMRCVTSRDLSPPITDGGEGHLTRSKVAPAARVHFAHTGKFPPPQDECLNFATTRRDGFSNRNLDFMGAFEPQEGPGSPPRAPTRSPLTPQPVHFPRVGGELNARGREPLHQSTPSVVHEQFG